MSLSESDSLYWNLPGSFLVVLKHSVDNPPSVRMRSSGKCSYRGFGGFSVSWDRTDVEFKWLAEATGVPVDEVPRALEAFSILSQFRVGHG